MTPVSPVLESGQHAAAEIVFAKDQPQYIPLPTLLSERGLVTTRWRLSLKERCRLLFSGSLYLQQSTFNHPLQPIRPSVTEPEDPLELGTYR